MNRRLYAAVAVAAAAAMALSACGGGGGQGDDGRVTLTFWDNQQSDSGLSEYQQTAVEEFEQSHPNIDVQVTTVPYDQYQQRLQLAVQGGDPPDVSTVDQIWSAAFAAGGAIAPLDERIGASGQITPEKFFPGAWESAQYDGQTWGIPFNVDVWAFTYYNQQLLDDAGVDPEQLTSWDGFRDAAQRLGSDGQFGAGLFGHQGEDTIVVMNMFVFSNGGRVLNDDGSCALDEPAAIEALEYYASLARHAPDGALNASSEDMRELFLNGSLATEWWPALEQPSLADSDLDWGFVRNPAPDGRTPVGTFGGWNLVIWEESENKDAAWEFIQFLVQDDVNGRVVDLVPANVDAAKTFLEDNRSDPDQILEHLNNARPRPLSPQYLQVSEAEQQMVQEILSGTPVRQAAASGCERIEQITG